MNMPTLQDEQKPIDIAIVNGIVASTPEHWTKIVMEVNRHVQGDGSDSMTILIGSPEGHGDLVKPSALLVSSLHELLQLFKRHGTPWSKVTYRLIDAGQGQWNFRAQFQYPAPS